MKYKALRGFAILGEKIFKDEVFDGSRLSHLTQDQIDWLSSSHGMNSPRIEETTDPIFKPPAPTPVAGANGGVKSIKTFREQLSYHESDNLPTGIDIANTSIITGHDLTAPGAKLTIAFKDTGATGRHWPEATLDVKGVIAAPSGYIWNHSGGYLQLYINDAKTGDIRFTDHTRSAAYMYSELWHKTPVTVDT